MIGGSGNDPSEGPASRGSDALGNAETADEAEALPTPDVPQEYRHLEERERAQGISLRQLFAEQEHRLRQKYADWIIWILGAQLLIADAVFLAFAWAGRGWDLSPGVIEVWLAATVVQVVGIVLIVTRHLFPNRDGRPATG
jgi:hypothetical protein